MLAAGELMTEGEGRHIFDIYHGDSYHIISYHIYIWVWVNTYRYIFSGMNIHLPAILGFTTYQGFDPSPYVYIYIFGSNTGNNGDD